MAIQCGIVGLPNVGKSTLIQRADAARDRGGELSVLHHRSERGRGGRSRRRGSTRSPPSCIPRRSCRPRWNSSTSRGSWPGRLRARASAISSWRTSARSMRSPTWCAASRTTTSCTWPVASIRSSDVDVINTELALADLEHGREGAGPRRQGCQERRQGGAATARTVRAAARAARSGRCRREPRA